MDHEHNAFGDWIKQRRSARDLTQADLADLVGCSLVTIQKLERGRRRPSHQILARLADALEIVGLERAAFLRLGRAQQREGSPAPPAPPAPAETTAHRLPRPLTPLIGREPELDALLQKLASPSARLVTLTGPAGVGKTRLALAAGAALADSRPGSVTFVPLATAADEGALAGAVAQALDEALPPGTPDAALRELLRERTGLLLLDNFEQIVGAAPILAAALQEAPGVRMLVTSRERLFVRGEQVQPLAPLRTPSLDALPPLAALGSIPSVALFCAVASAASPDFALTPANAPAVAQLCARLDGLPLAIEIVAAHADLASGALLERLNAQAALALRGPSDLPPRQRTLWAAFDWSYARLGPEPRRVFARLGVFAPGWDQEAAAAVDPAAPAHLDALVRASLLQRHYGDGAPRYALLETVREFALEQLGADADDARARHAGHYLAVAEAGAVGLRGADQGAWAARLRRDQPNLEAALGWLLSAGRRERAAQLAARLQRYWWMQGQASAARRWLGRILADTAQIPPLLLAQLWHALGTAESAQGDLPDAERSLRAGLAASQESGDPYTIGLCAHALGLVLADGGRHDEAERMLELGLEIDVETGDTRGQAISLGSLGGLAYHRRDFARARALFEESLALHRAVADLHSVVLTLNNLAEIVRRCGDDDGALRHLDEATELMGRIEGRRMAPYLLNNRAVLLSRRGRGDEARAGLAEAIALLRETGDRAELVTSLLVGARMWLDRGAARPAGQLLGAADQLTAAESLILSPVAEVDRAELAAACARLIGAAELDAQRRAGRCLTLDAAAALAAG